MVSAVKPVQRKRAGDHVSRFSTRLAPEKFNQIPICSLLLPGENQPLGECYFAGRTDLCGYRLSLAS
jgi:hypothetical protein